MAAQSDPLELILAREEDRLVLRSPAVGLFTSAVPKGQLLSPGQVAGALKVLDVGHTLFVPDGAFGRIRNDRPELVHAPVSYGTVLYELSALSDEGSFVPEEAAAGADASRKPGFRSPLAGRFWHRPSPDAPAFVSIGAVLEDGQLVGLIEVMKTFTQVHYRASGGLPSRGKVVRIATGDGDEVEEGQVLVELEEA